MFLLIYITVNRDPYETDFWPLNSPDLNTVHYKICDSEFTTKAQDM